MTDERSTQIESIETLLRQLPLKSDKHSRVPVLARALVDFNSGLKMHDHPWWQQAGPSAAPKQIEVFAKKVDALADFIMQMNGNVLVAVNAELKILNAEMKSRGRLLEVPCAEIMRDELTALAIAARAAKESVATRPRSGRRPDARASGISGMARNAFKELTGLPATRSVRIGDDQEARERGPFVTFLREIYKALDIDPKSAAGQARRVQQKRG